MKDTASFKLKLRETTAKINTIDCDFTQEKHLSILSEKVISKGHFCYKKENKIRWEYTEPYHYLIIMKDGEIHIEDEGKKTNHSVKSNKMFKQINDMMLVCIKGDIVNNSDFKIKLFEDKKFYLAELTPSIKQMGKYINSINILFDKADCSVSEFKIIESSEDFTRIVFINKKFNEKMGDEVFKTN